MFIMSTLMWHNMATAAVIYPSDLCWGTITVQRETCKHRIRNNQPPIQPSDGIGCVKGDCTNGVGLKIWSDGHVYYGRWVNGVKESKGGYRKNDKGLYLWPNGTYYYGYFKDGKKDGEGAFYSVHGVKMRDGFFERNKFYLVNEWKAILAKREKEKVRRLKEKKRLEKIQQAKKEAEYNKRKREEYRRAALRRELEAKEANHTRQPRELTSIEKNLSLGGLVKGFIAVGTVGAVVASELCKNGRCAGGYSSGSSSSSSSQSGDSSTESVNQSTGGVSKVYRDGDYTVVKCNSGKKIKIFHTQYRTTVSNKPSCTVPWTVGEYDCEHVIKKAKRNCG